MVRTPSTCSGSGKNGKSETLEGGKIKENYKSFPSPPPRLEPFVFHKHAVELRRILKTAFFCKTMQGAVSIESDLCTSKLQAMHTIPDSIHANLQQPFSLTSEQIQFYQKNRFIKLKQVFTPETIAFFNAIISRKVTEMNTMTTDLPERSTYGKAFLQLFNLWREAPDIRELVFSRRLGQIASDLMQTTGVRLYHDQALFKEAGGGITPWHADQYYWPLESDRTVTAWIPLQVTPIEMGPLEFSAGSHQIIVGRDLNISDESEQKIGATLRVTDFPHIIEPRRSQFSLWLGVSPGGREHHQKYPKSDDRDLYG
jgi:hypothetical protein